MCGIAGIITNRKSEPDRASLARMVEALIPRGPDSQGDFFNPHVALGHTRLKIIDLSDAGAQPMTDPGGRYTIVYNGEIYNYRDLRGNLEGTYRFKSRTDTEVVLASFINWKERCLDKFNGMFAFAIWDNESKSLFMARDRLGIKPLFYAIKNDTLIFASEQKSIIASGLVDKTLDPESIYHFLSFYHFPEPSTVYHDIKSLPAGTYARFSNDGFKSYRWWKPSFDKSASTLESRTANNLRVLLDDSTQLQQVSDVPVGCFLSGGVDSTAVSALMRKAVGAEFRTYTMAFEDDPHNALDVEYARIAAKELGTKHEYQNVPFDEVRENLLSILWRLEEPAWTSLETWFVSRLAKKGITVALAGIGGDELFAGYFPYLHMHKTLATRAFLGPLASATGNLSRWISGMMPDSMTKNPPFSSIKKYGMIENLDYPDAHYVLRSTFLDDEKQKLLTQDFQSHISGISSLEYTRDLMNKVPGDSYIDKFTLFDIQNYLSADLLRHVDSMSMSHSLEVRVPLLDHRFVEAALSCDDDMKIRDGKSKYIFMKAVSELLPSEIKNRSKVGFIFPMRAWLKKYFKNELRGIFQSQTFKERGIFNPNYVQSLVDEYLDGDDTQWLRLWQLFSFEIWARMYIDSDGSKPEGVSFREFVS